MAVRILLAKRNDNDTVSLPSFTLTGGNQPVAGRKLYIPIGAWNGVGAVGDGVSDSKGNTWSRKDNSTAVSNTRAMIFGCDYSGTGDVTITIDRGSGNWSGVYSTLGVIEVDDLQGSEVDTGARGASQGSTSGVDASVTGAGNTAQANNLLIACFAINTSDATANVAVPSGWTEIYRESDGSANECGGAFYKYISAVETPTVQFSYDDDAAQWQAVIIALKQVVTTSGAKRGMLMGVG